jgi:hypothetical protein
MTFPSDVIQRNIRAGLKPVLIPGKRLVHLIVCPECLTNKMVRFSKKGNGHSRKGECTCGYIYYTPGWKHGRKLSDAMHVGLRVGSMKTYDTKSKVGEYKSQVAK